MFASEHTSRCLSSKHTSRCLSSKHASRCLSSEHRSRCLSSEHTRRCLPAVRKIASIGKYYNVKSDHSDQVFFLYIGDEDPHDDLLDIKLKSYPTVLVFKDSEYFEYEAPDGIPTKSSLEFWVNTERYQAFPKVAGGNINDVAEMGKILVMVAIDENDKENEKVNSRYRLQSFANGMCT
ncbi:TXNDC10 [Mytilus edulis]|uniref:TXNDC10 n=1 Tax=Mytilus edulis TaxID=6550 RepID=A0A8S3SI76_MYTED|nr:TXNDC10 [Mytilus edulis]